MSRIVLVCRDGKLSITTELAEQSPVLKIFVNEKWKPEDSFDLNYSTHDVGKYIDYLMGIKIEQTHYLDHILEFFGHEVNTINKQNNSRDTG